MRKFFHKNSLPNKQYLLLAAVLALAVMWPTQVLRSSGKRFYRAATCSDSDPDSLKAWSGCWKLGPAQNTPLENNLFLRLKLNEKKFQIWSGGEDPSGGQVFDNPHYCKVKRRYTLAPERDLDFRGRYTQVFEMHDKPIRKWKGAIRNMYDQPSRGTTWQDFQLALDELLRKGGKYIRTWIVFKPNQVVWDNDAEEDMWALPVACEELEKEAQALKSIDPPK